MILNQNKAVIEHVEYVFSLVFVLLCSYEATTNYSAHYSVSLCTSEQLNHYWAMLNWGWEESKKSEE